jgi:hypothetical protein
MGVLCRDCESRSARSSQHSFGPLPLTQRTSKTRLGMGAISSCSV